MNLSIGGGATASLYEFARSSSVFVSYNTGVTALPAYGSTALGPILWNGNTGSPQKKAVLIGVSIALTTASTAAVSVGIVGGFGQATTPTSTTAATLVSCTSLFGKQPGCSAYKAGTVGAAGTMYLPLLTVDTAALTANPVSNLWIPLDGLIVIPQTGWIALAASATVSTSVLDCALVWAEVQH